MDHRLIKCDGSNKCVIYHNDVLHAVQQPITVPYVCWPHIRQVKIKWLGYLSERRIQSYQT